MVRINWLAVLELLWETFDVFSRRDCGWILAGYRSLPGQRRDPSRLLYTLEHDGLVTSFGSGAQRRFRVTAEGIRRLGVTDPAAQWQRPWDKRWRIVSYDLPVPRRRERQILWRTLRRHRLGLLQQSVWVWPHDLQGLLSELVESEGLPECFIGFESPALFLARHAEVVTAAWDWEEIARRHQTYLQHLVADARAVDRASDRLALARLARLEREAFQFAFSLDPMLPAALLPSGYRGRLVVRRRQEFRRSWRRRWAKLPDSDLPFD